MIRFLRASLLLSCCLLAACGVKTMAPTVSDQQTAAEAEMQRQMVVRTLDAYVRQYYRVAQKIRTANIGLCGEKVQAYIGMHVTNVHQFKDEWRNAQSVVRGLDERLRVTYVFEGGPACRAGVSEGDVIKSLNGKPIPEGEDAVKVYRDQVDMLDTGEPFELVYEHNGVDRTVTMAFDTICGGNLVVKNDPTVNAYASKTDVCMHTGILDFVKSDDELAVIVGHEFGHYAMLHNENRQGRATVGMVADVLLAVLTGVSTNTFANVGAGMYTLDQEFEADYVGAYMARRAGYDPSVAVELWRRMAVGGAAYIDKDSSTHPSTAERGARFKEIMAELDGKQKRGEELMPNLKDAE